MTTIIKPNRKKINRLIEVCENIWPTLTAEERDAYYCSTGTIGFIEDVTDILHICRDVITIDVIEYLCDHVLIDNES